MMEEMLTTSDKDGDKNTEDEGKCADIKMRERKEKDRKSEWRPGWGAEENDESLSKFLFL